MRQTIEPGGLKVAKNPNTQNATISESSTTITVRTMMNTGESSQAWRWRRERANCSHSPLPGLRTFRPALPENEIRVHRLAAGRCDQRRDLASVVPRVAEQLREQVEQLPSPAA